MFLPWSSGPITTSGWDAIDAARHFKTSAYLLYAFPIAAAAALLLALRGNKPPRWLSCGGIVPHLAILISIDEISSALRIRGVRGEMATKAFKIALEYGGIGLQSALVTGLIFSLLLLIPKPISRSAPQTQGMKSFLESLTYYLFELPILLAANSDEARFSKFMVSAGVAAAALIAVAAYSLGQK